MARPVWRIARWALIAALPPLVIAIQAAAITVLVRPFDPAELAATRAPLTLVDVHGEPLATIAAQGADRLHWTRLADLPAIAVSAVVESEDEQFWRHRGIDGAVPNFITCPDRSHSRPHLCCIRAAPVPQPGRTRAAPGPHREPGTARCAACSRECPGSSTGIPSPSRCSRHRLRPLNPLQHDWPRRWSEINGSDGVEITVAGNPRQAVESSVKSHGAY